VPTEIYQYLKEVLNLPASLVEITTNSSTCKICKEQIKGLMKVKQLENNLMLKYQEKS